MNSYYVYIMSNKSGTLYTGVTNDLEQRVYQHKNQIAEGFTKRYSITKLLYFESSNEVAAAIAREKQIKGMLRLKKIELIKTMNSQLEDLSAGWFDSTRKTATPHTETLRPSAEGLQGDNTDSLSRIFV